ncbi:unnamed protein product [Brachionus calyciflorus]|uniref:Uncharacterized protein n=1 Tax=Brachionus calyciflorus TaxID=104777 RepID=A0A813M036_9BILA|nr:unnamed protein product [Brachionus calyciflorus]
MIFLRQKPYGRPRNQNRHHRNHRNNRPIQLDLSNLSNEPTLTRRRRLNNSARSMDFIRSITLNERLASIGGLFGALSIIITGALLYAIFTAKTQDKWYYVIAVLINISILVILMIAAILFDRFYIKKNSNHRQIMTNRSSRIININPTLYNNLTSQPGILSNLNILVSRNDNNNNNNNNNLDYMNIRSYNDIPPEYPGYLEPVETNSDTLPLNNIPTNNQSKTISNQISTISSDIPNQLAPIEHSQFSTYLPLDSISNLNFMNPDRPQISPPKYHDLYPNNLQSNPSVSNSNQPAEANTATLLNNTSDQTIIQIDVK